MMPCSIVRRAPYRTSTDSTAASHSTDRLQYCGFLRFYASSYLVHYALSLGTLACVVRGMQEQEAVGIRTYLEIEIGVITQHGSQAETRPVLIKNRALPRPCPPPASTACIRQTGALARARCGV